MHDAPRTESEHPLGMTVYDLPTPSDVASADAKRTAAGRLRMLMVLLVCAAPVIASYFTYYVVRPEGRRNFGELIEPMRALPDITVQSLDGRDVSLSSLKDQWLLVSVAGGACADDCQRHLYLQRQILTGLGKDRARTEWVWLISDNTEVPSSLLPGLKEATVLRMAPQALAQWLVPAEGKTMSDHLYLVDPQGMWMMRFPAQLDTTGALKAKRDMERLLRAAAAWDEPGRDSPLKPIVTQ
jgi:hypothetical protein